MTADDPAVHIRRSTPDDFDGFYECFAEICLERRFLALVEAPPREATRGFIEEARARGMVQYVAVAASRVVGWCDIVPHPWEGFRHSGRLGMGITSAFRHQGIGRRLLDATVKAAVDAGLTRIELEVFSAIHQRDRAVRTIRLRARGAPSQRPHHRRPRRRRPDNGCALRSHSSRKRLTDVRTRHAPLATRAQFARRVRAAFRLRHGRHHRIAPIGMLGYSISKAWSGFDAYLERGDAARRMGPLEPKLKTEGGKLFAGLYALYAGMVVLIVAGMPAGAVFHRFDASVSPGRREEAPQGNERGTLDEGRRLHQRDHHCA
jgi:GNAT superfamily N-acetyltransferase